MRKYNHVNWEKEALAGERKISSQRITERPGDHFLEILESSDSF